MTPRGLASGAATWAVTAWDLFLITSTEFSLRRPMPPNWELGVAADELGPARSALKRSTRRSSRGSTL
jgi:hypothetical protein